MIVSIVAHLDSQVSKKNSKQLLATVVSFQKLIQTCNRIPMLWERKRQRGQFICIRNPCGGFSLRLPLRKRTPIFFAAVTIIAYTYSSISSSSLPGMLPVASALSLGHDPSSRFEYKPPSWAGKNVFTNPPPHGRLHLANLPTPLYKLKTTTTITTSQTDADHDDGPTTGSMLKRLQDELDMTIYVKRDDWSGGAETSGNKIRKLEFLLADALAKGKNSVVTIGGEQSNHCRATAAAARMVGLEPHLILRTRKADAVVPQQSNGDGLGYVGNVLFDRMVGSTIYTCTPGEYGRVGSEQLVDRVCRHIAERTNQESDPYPIPVGGSNAIGTWGYINAVEETLMQWEAMEDSASQSRSSLDHIVFACGSGGTAAGIALGMALAHGALEGTRDGSSTVPTVHAIGVCDSPDYFYGYVAKIADEMGLQLPKTNDNKDLSTTESFVRRHMIAYHGKGLGYAVSTPEELQFITNVALETGIVLDPVYSGKALYHFCKEVLEGGEEAEKFRGKRLLFWHTGT